MSLRILHISDLHERQPREAEPYRRDRVLGESWQRNLEIILSEGPIDLICFTGDIAYSGKREEYAAATQFIDTLRRLTNIPEGGLLIVPGNHDVNRLCNKSAYHNVRAAIDAGVDRLRVSRWMSGIASPPPGISPGWRQELLERQGEYQNWIRNDLGLVGIGPENSAEPHLGYRATLTGNSFQTHVIGLNTAWLSGDKDVPGNLLLTDDQFLRLASSEDGTPLKGLRIALMHHSFHDLEDGRHIQRLMAGRIDLVLRGHLHCTESSHFAIDNDRQFAEFAVSSLFDGGSADQYQNGCQVITVQPGDRDCTIAGTNWFRSWSRHGHWYDDDSLYETTKHGRLKWALMRFKNNPLAITVPGLNEGLPPVNSLSDYLSRLRRQVSQESIANGLIRPDRVYVSQYATEQSSTESANVNLLDVMGRFWNGDQTRIAVLGNYGMGKTYFALRTTLQQIDAFHNPLNKRIPIYYKLRNFNYSRTTASEEEKQDIIDQILENILSLDFPSIKRNEFIALIRNGKFGIILDGLDELNIPRGLAWHKVLEPLLSISEGSYVITSRTALIQNREDELSGWRVYLIQEWGEEQWRDYLDHCEQEMSEVGNKEKFLDLLSKKPQLSKLVTRPLWCYMIVAIRKRIQTSTDLAITDLYQEFLDNTVQRVMKPDAMLGQVLSVRDKFYSLERFAETCAFERTASLRETRFLELLNSIFLEIGLINLKEYLATEVKVYSFLNYNDRSYSFGHKTFGEYFLAAGIARQIVKNLAESSPRFGSVIHRHAYIARQELTDLQMTFLAGILENPLILKSLKILDPDVPADDGAYDGVKALFEKELTSRRASPELRRNLFLVYVMLLRRRSQQRPQIRSLYVREINLPKAKFDNCDFEGVDFSGANLAEADFQNSSLRGCRFQRAMLDGANFTGADLKEANFKSIDPPIRSPIFANTTNADLALFDTTLRQTINLRSEE